tara:strand:+ start:105 stop:656 length:552 start_codon:yes stop_codon:yes gene_type:complete
MILSIASSIFGFIVPLIYAHRKAGNDLFHFGDLTINRLIMAILLTIPVIIFGLLWSYTYQIMVGKTQLQGIIHSFFYNPSILVVLVTGFYGILAAPILEEVLFRGFLQPAIIKRFGTSLGILITSLIFGLFHIEDPWTVIPTAVVGGTAGWLKYRTGSLGTSIVFHAIYNLFVFIITYFNLQL